MKATKPNSWRDLTTCCEALVRANFYMFSPHAANALARDRADRDAADIHAFSWSALTEHRSGWPVGKGLTSTPT